MAVFFIIVFVALAVWLAILINLIDRNGLL